MCGDYPHISGLSPFLLETLLFLLQFFSTIRENKIGKKQHDFKHKMPRGVNSVMNYKGFGLIAVDVQKKLEEA